MPSVIIAGGGIAGLASAIAFERAGWAVSVHERAPAIRPLGAALSIWPNAADALDQLGLWADIEACAAPLRSMFVGDQSGRAIMATRDLTEPALMVTRAALQENLARALAVSLMLDDAIDCVTQDSEKVSAQFANGRLESADLFIDAGGIWSPIANDIVGSKPTYRGYGGVIALSDSVPDMMDGMACEYWGRHERFGLFEIADGCRYWFYMRSQAMDAAAPAHAELVRAARDWPAGIAEAIEATPDDRLVPFAIHARPPPRRLGSGRIICIGDAAHAMEPNLGQGACQALEDAAVLGVLAHNQRPERLLAAFEARRLKRIRTIVARASEARLATHGPPLVQLAMRGLLRALPATVLDRVSRDVQTMPAL